MANAHPLSGLGTLQGTALASLAATQATRTSVAQPNPGVQGIQLRVSIADYLDAGGVPTFTPSIQARDPSGTFREIWAASAALVANGETLYQLIPGAASGGGESFVEQASMAMPPSAWRVLLTVANGGAGDHATTLVDYILIP